MERTLFDARQPAFFQQLFKPQFAQPVARVERLWQAKGLGTEISRSYWSGAASSRSIRVRPGSMRMLVAKDLDSALSELKAFATRDERTQRRPVRPETYAIVKHAGRYYGAIAETSQGSRGWASTLLEPEYVADQRFSVPKEVLAFIEKGSRSQRGPIGDLKVTVPHGSALGSDGFRVFTPDPTDIAFRNRRNSSYDPQG